MIVLQQSLFYKAKALIEPTGYSTSNRFAADVRILFAVMLF
jgi:hypothetical protein